MKEKEKNKVFSQYQWEEGSLERLTRDRYQVLVGEEEFILLAGEKRDPYFAGEIFFRRYLEEEGCNFLPPLVLGKDKEPLFRTGTKCYAVEKKIKCREFSFRKKDLLMNAMKTLAPFHQKSEGYEAKRDGLSQSHLGQWPARLERNLIEGEHYLQRAMEKPEDPALMALLERMEPLLLRRGEKGLLSLCLSPYEELAEKTFLSGRLSYGAVNSRGLGYYKSRVFLTDFSRLNHDLAAADLWQIFRRYLSFRGNDPEEILTALRVYESCEPLLPGETEVLKALLCFPYYTFKLIKRLAKAKGGEESVRTGRHLYGVLRAEEENDAFYHRLLMP